MPKKLLSILLIFITTLFFVSCDSTTEPNSPDESNRGEVVRSEELSSYTVEYINSLLSFTGAETNLTAQFPITVYKLVYYTLDPWGNVIEASGAVFVPNSDSSIPLLSLQHGTQSKRTFVASVDPNFAPEGILASSLGYYACVQDYIGLGVSEIIHPYHYAETSANSTIDFIRASKEFAYQNNISLNDQVFLAGYSEGGYVTMAAQKEIELNYSGEIDLTAVSAMAGAYDLAGTSINLIEQNNYTMPGFISFLLVAYNNVYGWNRLSEIFNSPYSDMVTSLFDGSNTISEINSQLTDNISELFTSEFITDITNETDTETLAALSENSLLNWTPTTPLLLVHGNADEFVPYQNSVTAYNNFIFRGAENIRLVTVENGTHATSVIPAILETMTWFNTFLSE